MKESKSSFVDSITKGSSLSFGKKKNNTTEQLEIKQKEEPVKTKAPIYKKEDKKKFKFLEFKKPKFFSLHGSLIILLLLPICLFGVVSYLYQTHNEGKIYTGVSSFGVDIGGKTKEEAGKLIDNKITTYKLVIEGENQKFEASYADLGINYDKEKILENAYNYGRDESILTNFFNRGKRFFSKYEIALGDKKYSFKGHNINLVYNVNQEKLNTFLADLETKINISQKDY